MSQEFSLITRLEKKIYELDRDREIAQKIINKNSILLATVTAIEEYVVLTRDSTIPLGIRYLALSCIAKQYQLYQDEREISQLKDIMGREIDIPSYSEIFNAIQIVKDRYYQIYECNQREFDRIERLVKEMSPNSEEWGRNIDVVEKVDASHSTKDKYVNVSTSQPIIIQSTVSNSTSEKTNVILLSHIKDNFKLLLMMILLIGTGSGIGIYFISRQQPQDEAVKLVQQWLETKKNLFSSPFDRDSAASLVVGKAYRDKVRGPSSDGTPDSVSEWLEKRGYYYSYGLQRIDTIKRFEMSNNSIIMDVQIT
jgi:ARC6-like, IMS domain